jgi:hypothetical protein
LSNIVASAAKSMTSSLSQGGDETKSSLALALPIH